MARQDTSGLLLAEVEVTGGSVSQRSSFERSDISFDSGLRGLRDGASWVERLSNGTGQAHFVQLDAFDASNPASILH